MNQVVCVVVLLQVCEGRVVEVEWLLLVCVQLLWVEDGCLFYVLYWSFDEVGCFVFVECWVDCDVIEWY